MKTQTFRAFALGLSLLAANTAWADEEITPSAETTSTTAPAADTETVGKLKVQNIRTEDRFGAIEEDRVQAMRSEVRYVPTGSDEGYNLIGAENSQGKTRNAHSEENNLMIPSWKLFAW